MIPPWESAANDVPGARGWLAPTPAGRVEPGEAPSFSVIIAAYQAAETIGEAVASALEQTLPPLEVIVCDDASTDHIEGALARFDERVTLIRRERNGGPAAARNEAVGAARGDFVAPLDADDVFFPRRLEAVAALASARPDLDLLATDELLEVDGQTIRRAYDEGWVFEVADQRLAILRYNFIHRPAVRRTAWLHAGGQDESISWTEDWELWIRLILAGSRAGLVTEPLALYRLNPSSLTANQAQMRRGEVMTLERTAAGAHDLSPAERLTLSQTLEERRRAARLEGLREALAGGAPDARRRARAVVAEAGLGLPTRAKVAAGAVFPGLVGRMLRRRRRREWIAAGGLRIKQEGSRT